MMNMINDYYRSEFQRKVQTESDSKAAEETPLNVDNFMDYVRDMDTKNQSEVKTFKSEPIRYTKPDLGQSHLLLRFLQITNAYPISLDICSPLRTAADSSIS